MNSKHTLHYLPKTGYGRKLDFSGKHPIHSKWNVSLECEANKSCWTQSIFVVRYLCYLNCNGFFFFLTRRRHLCKIDSSATFLWYLVYYFELLKAIITVAFIKISAKHCALRSELMPVQREIPVNYRCLYVCYLPPSWFFHQM